MRKNIVAGNWKMNTTLQEGLELAKGLNEALKGKAINCDVIIGTPFTHLASIAAAIDTDKIGVAAENCADKEKGAYTGEVSAAMVASTGAKYVILGHSERRAYYHETFLLKISVRSFWLTNRFGLSVQARLLLLNRLKKSTLISVLHWLQNMVTQWLTTAQSCMVVALMPVTQKNCSLNRT